LKLSTSGFSQGEPGSMWLVADENVEDGHDVVGGAAAVQQLQLVDWKSSAHPRRSR
jgi:hypothetical protein